MTYPSQTLQLILLSNVVPNGKLISDPLTNWTFSNRQRLITIPIAVAVGTPPEQVRD
jgi:small-conductance mechanosensitive channel